MPDRAAQRMTGLPGWYLVVSCNAAYTLFVPIRDWNYIDRYSTSHVIDAGVIRLDHGIATQVYWKPVTVTFAGKRNPFHCRDRELQSLSVKNFILRNLSPRETCRRRYHTFIVIISGQSQHH